MFLKKGKKRRKKIQKLNTNFAGAFRCANVKTIIPGDVRNRLHRVMFIFGVTG